MYVCTVRTHVEHGAEGGKGVRVSAGVLGIDDKLNELVQAPTLGCTTMTTIDDKIRQEREKHEDGHQNITSGLRTVETQRQRQNNADQMHACLYITYDL